MLNYARSICIIHHRNCNTCPIKKVCKRKIRLSREEVEEWIGELEIEARKIILKEHENE